MDYYERKLKRSGINYRACFYSMIAIAILIIILLLGKCVGHCSGDNIKADTVTVVERDTVTVEVHDTIPQIKKERVLKYIPIPPDANTGMVADSSKHDSIAVVQREYSDDSTYTAWVSGVEYDVWPKLDSIHVCRQMITEHIKETITLQKKGSRWSLGVQAGVGYGFKYKGIEPYIGVGLNYKLYK